jgi:hypothetical protein
VRKVAPRSLPLGQLRELGRFATFLQRENGSFVLMYRSKTGPVEHFHSPYYPGEAVLGLIALYEADHAQEWLAAAGKALTYLARDRTEALNGLPDHWVLIALAKFLPYCDQATCPGASRTELIQFSIQACNSIVYEQWRNPASPLDGAFDRSGQTAMTSARLEGLLAALEFLPIGDLRGSVERAVERGVSFLLRAQIKSGQFAGGMPGAIIKNVPNSSQIRIDYVQHTLCALLAYQSALRLSANAQHGD